MEVEGLRRGLLELGDRGIAVKILTTDRSKSVATMVKNEFGFINHLFDPWHYIKGLHKIFREATKLKTAPEMKAWLSPILNHIWHSVIQANGDGNRCTEFIYVTLIHTLGIHQWQGGRLEDVLHRVHSKFSLTPAEKKKYRKNNPSNIKSVLVKDFNMSLTQCPHSPRLSESPESGKLLVYSKVYNVILNALTAEHTFLDMQQLSPHLSTANLENLHSLITGKYRSKDKYYEMEGNRRVIKKVQRKAKHKGGEYVWRKIKTPPNYSWKKRFNDLIIDNYVNDNIIKPKPRRKKGEDDEEIEEDEEGNDYCVEVDYEFDEYLIDEIHGGRAPSALLRLFEEGDN
uniref:Transposase n=1 Tax=Panagrolaimus davidi TaxID=227884 RepID=A0A914QYL1_9BILA